MSDFPIAEKPKPKPAPTRLGPLEEALFKVWARANGVEDPDNGENQYDHRGVYMMTRGKIHPPNAINDAAQTFNAVQEGQGQMQDRIHGLMSDEINDFGEHIKAQTNVAQGHNDLIKSHNDILQGEKDSLEKQLMQRCM